MPAAPGTETGVRAITVAADRFGTVALAPRMRNRFAPVRVGADVESVRLAVTPYDPAATVTINGTTCRAGEASSPVALWPGRNRPPVAVTAADGRTRAPFEITLFRDHPAPAWRLVNPAPPWAPRDSAGELVFGGRLWLFGGYVPETVRDVWSSPDGVSWERTGEIAASRRGIDIPLTFDFDGRMWVSDLDGDLYASPDGARWTLETDRAPWRGRHAAGGAVFGGRLWVMGGSQDGRFLNDVWSSADGRTWRLETGCAPWSKRILHNTPLVLDGRLWLIGGAAMGDYYPFRAYNDVWSTADGREWRRETDEAPWPGRIWGSTAVYRDRLWLLGGFRSEPAWENLGDVWYSADGANWTELAFPPPCRHSGGNNQPVTAGAAIWERRHEMSVYAHDGKLWVAGGMVWPLVNDVWSLEIPGLTFLTQPVVEEFTGTRYRYRARADFNRGRGPVRYRLAEGPGWLTVDPESGLVEGVPPAAGDVRVTLEAFDAANETAVQDYILHIVAL